MNDDMPRVMTPEDQLCLLLARPQITLDVQSQISELIAGPFRWPLLVEHAYKYGIAPLICRSLETLGFPGVPDAVRTELGNCLAVNAIRNELLAKELARLLQLLEDAKIPVIPLKSTVLAEALYGDPALRVCADIDLLVPVQNVTDAHNLIVSSGYTSQITQPFFLDLMARYGKDCELMREDELCNYPLELHCGLEWGGSVERDLLKEVWAEVVQKSFYGVPAFALSSDWEFLYLATHAARHSGFALKWFVDIDRFCSRNQLDWGSIKEKAQRLGWEHAVRYSLWACSDLLGTRVDPAFAPTTSKRRRRALNPASLEVPGGVFFLIRLLKTPGQRLRFLAIRLLVPTPADGRFIALPPSVAFLYYLLRPFRVIAGILEWLADAAVKSLRRILHNKFGN